MTTRARTQENRAAREAEPGAQQPGQPMDQEALIRELQEQLRAERIERAEAERQREVDLRVARAERAVMERQQMQQPPPPAQAFKAPRYTGVGSVEVFIQHFQDVAETNNWAPGAALLHLRGVLEDEARDCGAAGTVDGIFAKLRARYGMTPREARAKLTSIKKEFKTSLQEHASRIEELVQIAYPDMEEALRLEMSLDSFCNSLGLTALQRHLLAVRPESLQAAVLAGNEYLQVKTNPAGIRRVEDAENHSSEEDPVDPAPTAQAPATVQPVQMPSTPSDPTAVFVTALAQLTQQMEAIQGLLAGKKADRKPVTCWRCGKTGHVQRDCRVAVKAQQENLNGQQ